MHYLLQTGSSDYSDSKYVTYTCWFKFTTILVTVQTSQVTSDSIYHNAQRSLIPRLHTASDGKLGLTRFYSCLHHL